MKRLNMRWFACLAAALATLTLAGCASSPPAVHVTLVPGLAGEPPRGERPSLIITQTNLPELIDRPQLVVRSGPQQLRIIDQWRWGEPLRREIPRLLAEQLGQALDSSRIVSRPADNQGMDADFRLRLDVQRLEAVAGEGAVADVLWRLEPRQGPARVGRSVQRAAVEGEDAPAWAAAQRRALQGVAGDIARAVREAMGTRP